MKLNNPYDPKIISNRTFSNIQKAEQETGAKFGYETLNEGNCSICKESCPGRICLICNVYLCRDHYASHLKHHS